VFSEKKICYYVASVEACVLQLIFVTTNFCSVLWSHCWCPYTLQCCLVWVTISIK